MAETPIPQAMLDASGVVGTWEHDPWADRVALSGTLARLIGLDPAAAAAGLPLAAFLERTHPEDRPRVESYLHAMGEIGGPLEAEFRVLGAQAGPRKLLLRGRIERDASGRTGQGQGIAIDLTENRAADLQQGQHLVNRMAEHALALRGLADAMRRPELVARIEGLMTEIGFELARYLQEPGDRPRH